MFLKTPNLSCPWFLHPGELSPLGEESWAEAQCLVLYRRLLRRVVSEWPDTSNVSPALSPVSSRSESDTDPGDSIRPTEISLLPPPWSFYSISLLRSSIQTCESWELWCHHVWRDYLCVCVCVSTRVPWYVCGDQRTTCGSCLCCSTMWVLGIQLRSSGLVTSSFTL